MGPEAAKRIGPSAWGKGMRTYRHLYGPVPSRRLGRSLGIDLVPHKICTYDCIYCQVGKTTHRTLQRKEYIPVEEVLEEVKHYLKEETCPVDHLSLSGSGEPTLHSRIRSIIEGIKTMTSIPVAVITNGSLLFEEEVRKDLLGSDKVLPSLDAVSPEVFMKVNRPHPEFKIEEVIEGMVEFRKIYNGQIWLEILFCKGVNDGHEELMKIKQVVDQIQPDRIHLNTVIRPPSEKWVAPLNQEEMEAIQSFLGEKASIISEFNRHPPSVRIGNIKEEILRILRRRPLSFSDLSRGIGVREEELDHYIGSLLEEKRIRICDFGNKIFYEVSEKKN